MPKDVDENSEQQLAVAKNHLDCYYRRAIVVVIVIVVVLAEVDQKLLERNSHDSILECTADQNVEVAGEVEPRVLQSQRTTKGSFFVLDLADYGYFVVDDED